MSFIRSKEIPPGSGNWYDYEVKGIREGQRVRQVHIRYIGKSSRSSSPSLSGGSSIPAINAKPVTDAILTPVEVEA